MSAYNARGVIALAVGAGEACKAAMLLRKPCLGICLSEAHIRLLFDHLVDWMLSAMEDQGNVFYNQSYKTWKAGGTPIKALPTPKPKRSRSRSRKHSRSKSRGGKKGKKPRKGKKHSDNESSSED